VPRTAAFKRAGGVQIARSGVRQSNEVGLRETVRVPPRISWPTGRSTGPWPALSPNSTIHGLPTARHSEQHWRYPRIAQTHTFVTVASTSAEAEFSRPTPECDWQQPHHRISQGITSGKDSDSGGHLHLCRPLYSVLQSPACQVTMLISC
jgi:hypothetical protein